MSPAPLLSTRILHILALSLALLAAVTCLLWLNRGLGRGAAGNEPASTLAEGVRPNIGAPSLPPTEEGGEDARRAHDTPIPEGRPNPKQVVSGVLADADSGLSLSEHLVILSWHPTDDAPTKVESRTDAGGNFRFELRRPWWKMGRYYNAQVLDPSGREVFRGQLLLASEVSLVVHRRPVLRGRLETQPPIDYEGVLLRVWTPPAQALETELLCGETRLAPDGSFVVEIDEPVRSENLMFVFADRVGGFADAILPRSVLESGVAPPIVRQLVELDIVVHDASQHPVAGARLRILPVGLAGNVRWNSRHSDREGRARVRLQVGTYELLASLADHRPVFQTLELDAPPLVRNLDLNFEAKRSTDQVRGEVFAYDGKPVAGARVELFPTTPEMQVGSASVDIATSDSQGRFVIQTAGERPFVLHVAHADHGQVRLEPRLTTQGPVTVRFLPLGRVQVRPTGIAIDSSQSSGPMQWFLIEQSGGRVLSGYSNGCPWTIDGVVTGSYELLVMGHGQEAFGEAMVEVVRGELRTVAPSLARAHVLEGLVETPETLPLPGLTAELLHPRWPAEVISAWASTKTDSKGRFRIFAGDLPEGVIVLRQGVQELTRVKLRSDGVQRINLPE